MDANITSILEHHDPTSYLNSRDSKKIGNNTYMTVLERWKHGAPKKVALRYHNTDVVVYDQKGITLDTKGWWTLTTKQRMNWGATYVDSDDKRRSLYCVGQWNRIWYVSGVAWPKGSNTIRLDWHGNVLDGQDDESRQQVEREWQRALRAIRRYTNGFGEEAKNGNIPEPGPGDCWYCMMYTESGDPLGDTIGDVDHLLSHIKEKYYVPSLLVNAVRYRRQGMAIPILLYGPNGWNPGRNWRMIASDVRKYMQDKIWPYIRDGGRIK